MKIAFFSQPMGTFVLPPSSALEIWTCQIARRLARSHDVVVYARRGFTQEKVEWDGEVQFRRIRVARDSRNVDRLLRLLKRFARVCHFERPLFASRLHYLSYALQAANDLRAQQCAVVHVHNFSQFVPIIRAFNPKVKIILHMHCEWLTQLPRAMIERRLREVSLVVGCSGYITEKMRRRFPRFATRCQTIFNGVDVNHFVGQNSHNAAKKKGAKRLLFVGRVSPEKGLHVLLDAFQKVLEHYPQTRLEVVGPAWQVPREYIVALSDDDRVSDLASFYHGSAQRSYLSQLQERLPSHVASHVTFTGFVSNAQVVNYYRDADVLINPSLSEAFGVSLIEAMACQVPVVAARVGGMPEIVEEGKTGILVEPGDAPALAEAILRLLADEDLRQSMGKAARQRVVECFSWDRIAERWLCQYKNLCEDNE